MMKKLTAFLKAYALPIFAVFAIVLGIVFVNGSKNATSAKAGRTPVVFWNEMGGPGALLVAGVILSLFTSFGWIGFVLAIVAAGAGWYVAKQSQSVTPEAPVVDIDALNRQLSQVQQQLTTISERFGLAGIPGDQYFNFSGDAIALLL